MQKIYPAMRNMKEFEIFLSSHYETAFFLDIHISQLKNIRQMAKEHHKKIFFHMDLIHGLKNDDYATEYICQEVKPKGLISTKANVIAKAKQRGIVTVQRIFLLDSQALEKNLSIIKRTKPDYIEVLPGAMPWIIKEIKDQIDIPIFAGGFIRKVAEVEQALEAGATAITTTNVGLWKHYEKVLS